MNKDMEPLSEDVLQEYAEGTDIRLVSSLAQPDGDTIKRALDAADVNELQQSKLTSVANGAVYRINPEENRGFFTVRAREGDLERAISRRERNKRFPDDVSPELVLAREASWIASTINNGQRLRRTVGRVSHDSYYVEVAEDDGAVVMQVVFVGEGR